MKWVRGRRQRLSQTALVAAVGLIVVFGCAVAAHAQTGAPKVTPGLISLDVVDADLSQVVRILMSESKQNIVIGDADVKQKKVTAMLTNVPLETALRYVVESVGCSWRREPDGVYLIGTRPQNAEATVSPALQSAVGDQRQPVSEAPRIRKDTRVEKIKLYNSSPSELMWAMGIYRIEDAPKVEKFTGTAQGIYVQNLDGTLSPVAIPPGQVVPMTESLKANPSVAQRAPGLYGEAAQAAGPPTGYPYRPQTGRPGQPNLPPQPGALQNQTGGLLPEGIDSIMTYEPDNSFLVRGSDEGIEELKAIISKLDIAPRQIMIEARFVSISTSELESLGINWSLERMNTAFSTAFATAGNVLIGFANNDLVANLRAQLSKTSAKVINAPIVTTMNNMMANIGFQTMVPYLTSTTVFNQTSGGTSSASAVAFLSVTSQLYVLPRINNADNSITCLIMPQISDIEGKVDAGVNGTIPIVSSQILATTRRVANGETIILGGLIRKSTDTRVEKIPLLGDLPIIGPLFRSTKDDVNDKELLIFLTPTIVAERPVSGQGVGVIP